MTEHVVDEIEEAGSMLDKWQLRPGRLWHRHPGVRHEGELTLGERAADRIRNGMGSWGFVFGSLLFLAGWMAGNRNSGFDPYPFILLNLVLSCVAALQGAILLIAARRADQIAAELAMHDYETDVQAAELMKTLHEMTIEIREATVPSRDQPPPRSTHTADTP